jgi:hypothetical protein
MEFPAEIERPDQVRFSAARSKHYERNHNEGC